MEDKGTLYLVATPIGNLEDITFRAIKTLKEVDLIAAEDTRQTLKLLNYYKISKPLISYHRGEEIVKEAIKNNIKIVPIPGACAMINALIASGLNTKEFAFYGFLPLNKKNRKEIIDEIINEGKTTIIYEAPHRIISTLNEFLNIFGDINIVVAKEITKIHEQFFRGKISEVIKLIDSPKGEFIIILEIKKIKKENELNNLSIEEHYKFYQNQGLEKKEIIKKIAKDLNVNKNEIYQKFINK